MKTRRYSTIKAKRPKYYWTKERKRQLLFWKVLLGSFLTAVAIIGAFDTYTSHEMSKMQSRLLESLKTPFKIEVVKAEKEVLKNVVVTIYETTEQKIRRIATEECKKQSLGEQCVHDLLGMAYTESRFNCDAIGDGGKSYGCFQIHRGYHPHITVAQAKDLNFSIPWTLNRMISKNYKKNRDVAVMSHNGTPYIKRTKQYLTSVNNYIKNYE